MLKKATMIQAVFFTAAAFLIISVFAIVAFTATGLRVFTQLNPANFFFGTSWSPSQGQFGVVPMIYGSFMTTMIALLFSAPLAILVAIFMSEIAPPQMQRPMRSTVELFAALPSVIYGFLALTIIVPWVRVTFDAPLGVGILPAAIVLIFMVQPTMVTISEDALRSLPRAMREGSLALGATRWQTIWGVLLPGARQGIITAIILGIGRAIGETMAVQMVIGNIPNRIPPDLVSGAATMPSLIVAQQPEAVGFVHENALVMVGFLLLAIVFVLIFIVRRTTGPAKLAR